MQKHKQALGIWGEKVAVHELEKIGWKIITTNFNTNVGEIDIIAKDKGELVFVEVKTRSNNWRGSAIEQISYAKKKHLMLAAQVYLTKNRIEDVQYRIDVVALDKMSNGNWKFSLLKNAVAEF